MPARLLRLCLPRPGTLGNSLEGFASAGGRSLQQRGWVHRPAFGILVVVCCSLILSPAAPALENRYDVLGKVLAPWINVFARNPRSPQRALKLTARLESMTGLQAEESHIAELALQYPEQLRLQAPILGEEMIVCRNGQKLWASPATRIRLLVERATAERKLPPRDPSYRLQPFQLPVPDKQLVFLPVLFQVADAGTESLGGEECRVLEVTLAPPLEKALVAGGWKAKLWVRPGYRLARLALSRPGWDLVARIEKLDFLPQLPASTWEPPENAASEVMSLDPPLLQQLLRSFIP